MNLQVRGKNIQVTNALKDHVEKRIGKLEKYFENYTDEAQVTLVVEKDTHKVEVTIPINGMYLRGEIATGDMYSSIDQVVDKLEKQINRYKGKISRRGPKGLEDIPVRTAAAGHVEEGSKVIRTKHFAVKPMPVEEAVLQMNLLGHDFFVFSNAETEEVNVLYRRKDGNLGLIEPEYL